MRVNVYLPDELVAQLKTDRPSLNLSRFLRDALAELATCRHDAAVCGHCAAPIDVRALVDVAKERLYLDTLGELGHLVRSGGGTPEGAARIVKEVAQRHQVRAADRQPLPRPTREARRRAKVTELPREADSRAKHPTARTAPSVAPAVAVPEEATA